MVSATITTTKFLSLLELCAFKKQINREKGGNMVFGSDPSGNSSSRKNSRSKKNDETNNKGKKLSALIVDDDPIVRKVHNALLIKFGLEPYMVENGKEAVDLYRSGTCFDLVLMDMEMPITDGLKATKELRDMGVNSMIVGITSRRRDSEKQAFMKAGLNYCYEKPLKAEIVNSLIHDLLNKF